MSLILATSSGRHRHFAPIVLIYCTDPDLQLLRGAAQRHTPYPCHRSASVCLSPVAQSRQVADHQVQIRPHAGVGYHLAIWYHLRHHYIWCPRRMVTGGLAATTNCSILTQCQTATHCPMSTWSTTTYRDAPSSLKLI